MKTVEEWATSIELYKQDKNFIEFIKQIQLDAWKQGMSDAFEEVLRYKDEHSNDQSRQLATSVIGIRLITARDNKTTI